MLCKHFKNSQTSGLDKLSQKRVCLKFPPKKTNKQKPLPSPPKHPTRGRSKVSSTFMRGCSGWAVHGRSVSGWEPGRAYFWETSHSQCSQGRSAPCLRGKEFKQHRSQRKRLWVEMSVSLQCAVSPCSCCMREPGLEDAQGARWEGVLGGGRQAGRQQVLS